MKSSPHFDPDAPAPEALSQDEQITYTPEEETPPSTPFWKKLPFQLGAAAVVCVLFVSCRISGNTPSSGEKAQFVSQEEITQTGEAAPPEPVRPLPAEQPLPDDETDALNDTLAALRIHSEKTREGLTALARRLDTLESRISELQKHTVPAPAATAPSPQPTTPTRKAPRAGRNASPLSGVKIDSLYPGLAWVTWQGSSWALRPGDQFAGTTILSIDEQKREIVTSAGVIRQGG
ncbi:conjugal transfer protein TraP [Escherichia marmotae]|uniref:Conjugal transfer protein TraP n=1 Tax=Escherichia marmotae TaxID=1499973 RepID=A0A7H9KFU9_9ESCH|nr:MULTISPECIES: conjugal transfer protein TraP [Escherichia]EFH6731672.1 conjugal transfer protein TraP [Escherichia coli]EFH6904742.1 conjugal transfer protein TraP [Escherichia coli]EFJ4490906.1 conjugal transfer protein TraP [Escherichia coli]EFU2692305.1 conjugal transfer protein TraP [Escherichia coli]EGH1319172.1 conjugal transfer protein TraP [Escherichia coli]